MQFCLGGYDKALSGGHHIPRCALFVGWLAGTDLILKKGSQGWAWQWMLGVFLCGEADECRDHLVFSWIFLKGVERGVE